MLLVLDKEMERIEKRKIELQFFFCVVNYLFYFVEGHWSIQVIIWGERPSILV